MPSADRMLARWIDWDRLGIGLSGLCVVHCLLTPVVMSLLPLWPTLQAVNAWVHPSLLALLLPVIVGAMRRARRTGRVATAALLGSGFLVLVGAWWGHALWGPIGERLITIAGSALLIGGHVQNWRRHRACKAVSR
ncbi:MerC domain-containing protein [Salinibacter altiplanensis]|uniref:MerC domain-containing protein n=1 Tax=Salinibacter altiplanensis TaxID=1803181 RepID=UPI000C9FE8C2|nr:MerC domain-containing protein [Salinibacter altiplanensis]